MTNNEFDTHNGLYHCSSIVCGMSCVDDTVSVLISRFDVMLL
jgi:hypothetical protein